MLAYICHRNKDPYYTAKANSLYSVAAESLLRCYVVCFYCYCLSRIYKIDTTILLSLVFFRLGNTTVKISKDCLDLLLQMGRSQEKGLCPRVDEFSKIKKHSSLR